MSRIAASLVFLSLLGLGACSDSYSQRAYYYQHHYRADPHCAIRCGIQNTFS